MTKITFDTISRKVSGCNQVNMCVCVGLVRTRFTVTHLVGIGVGRGGQERVVAPPGQRNSLILTIQACKNLGFAPPGDPKSSVIRFAPS